MDAEEAQESFSAEEMARALEDEFLPPKTRAFYKRQANKAIPGAHAQHNKVRAAGRGACSLLADCDCAPLLLLLAPDSPLTAAEWLADLS